MNRSHHKTFIVDQDNIRIDMFLSSKIEGLSRSKIKKLIINGKVLVNNKIVKPSLVLTGEEEISCDLEIEKKQITLIKMRKKKREANNNVGNGWNALLRYNICSWESWPNSRGI